MPRAGGLPAGSGPEYSVDSCQYSSILGGPKEVVSRFDLSGRGGAYVWTGYRGCTGKTPKEEDSQEG